MPMELHQLSTVPQAHDEPQPRLEHTQGGIAYGIDELLLARGDNVCAPQQQPGVDQRQSQQQPLQAVGVAHAGQLQAKAPPVIFEIFKHFFDTEPLLVGSTGALTGRLRGNQIPGFGGGGRPVHRQIEAAGRMFLRERHLGPEAAFPRQHQWQYLKIRGTSTADVLVGAQAQAHAPALAQGPLRQYAGAKLPIPQQEHVRSARQPLSHDGQQRLLLRKARRPGPQPPPQQGQGPPAPPDTDIQEVKDAPLGAVYRQMNPGAAAGQPLQDPSGQRLIVQFDRDAGVFQKPLHALLDRVPSARQGGGRQDPADLQALAAQDAQSYSGQIHQAGERFQRQITLQLGNQVGKHLVLWFDHGSLRGTGCSVCGYDRSQPRPRRLFPSACYRFFYCPLVRGREAELRQLHSWLEKTLEGERQVVFVTGEPGLGTTAVVHAFLHQAAARGGIRIARGQCIEHYGAGEPYMPVLAALEQLCRTTRDTSLLDLLRRYAQCGWGKCLGYLTLKAWRRN